MICLSIVSHGQLDLAKRLFDSLLRHPSPLVTQVVYTRNIPEDPLPAHVRGLPGLREIDNPVPKGYGANHNAAFSLCEAPCFCVLNPDIEWVRDPFRALFAALESRGNGLVAPRVIGPDGALENTARRVYTPLELVRQKLRPRNHAEAPDWLAGMFMLFKSDAYRAIGGFDTSFHLYIEDVDICSRLQLEGWRLAQVQEAEVVHRAQSASHRSLQFARWHLAGMLKYWSSPVFWRYRAIARNLQRSA